MLKFISFVFLILLLVGTLVSCRTLDHSGQMKYDLAIKNIDLFDSENKEVLKGKTLLINADTVAGIVSVSEQIHATEMIEGEGRLVVPGLIDTHTHLSLVYGDGGRWPAELLPDSLARYRKMLVEHFMAYGVTTLVDMGQSEKWFDVTLDWQKNPSPDYPNLFNVGGSLVSDLSWDQHPPMHHIKLKNEAEARGKVQAYANRGLKYLKLYWKLEADEMKVVIDEASRHNMGMYAHVDNNFVSISDAMDMGVTHFEHFFALVASTVNLREHGPQLQEEYGVGRAQGLLEYTAMLSLYFDYINNNPVLKHKLEGLLDQMAENNASISTAVHILGAAAEKAYFFSTFDGIHVKEPAPLTYTEAQKKQLKQAFDVMMQFVKLAHEKGVKIRIGTDSGYGGKALLSELMLLAEAGIPMEDVLQIATWNGAEAMNLQNQLGSLKAGKKADLVIFEDNPFIDPQHVLSSKVVVKDGRVLRN